MLGELQQFGDLLDRNARLYGEKLGLAMDGERLSWSEAEVLANRFGTGLQNQGFEQGERIGLVGENSLALALAFFALPRAGLVPVPLNYRLTASEMAGILEDAGATALLAGEGYLEIGQEIAQRLPALRLVAGLGRAPGSQSPSFEDLLASGSEERPTLPTPVAPDDLLLLLYTSGTTGLPKGVIYTHQRALIGTLIHVLAIGSAHRHRVMLPSPLYSAAGFAGLACAVAVGCTSHLLRFSVESALETLERERITYTNLVPTTLKMLLEHPRCEKADLSALEVLLYGGSPMPEGVLRAAAARLQCGFRQTFATSETGLAGTVLEPEDHRRALEDPGAAHRLLSCGRPQVGVGIRLLGADGLEVPVGEVGEVAIRCDANMTGYWNRPKATAEALREGEVLTGDLARRDEEGYFYLVDRKHDRIVSGALNVYPTEVERVLVEHPEVVDCAVIGVPDERWGEAVKAFVVEAAGAGLSEDSLLAWCRDELAGHKRPKSIEFVDEIPRNPTGKPLRRELRRPYWQDETRSIR